jgi:hypothetical protein
MSRRKTHVNRSPADDPSSLAGWMYADLLLALTIIFLATISFVPQFTNTVKKSGGTIVNSNLSVPDFSKAGYSQGLSITATSFDANKLMASVNSFAKMQNLGNHFEIPYARIIGGYDPTKESANYGTLNAVAFAVKLEALHWPYFKSLNTSVTSSSAVPEGYVRVEFTVIPSA